MATTSLRAQNWFSTTLSSSISASDTTISLNAVPTNAEGYLVIEPDNSSNREVIYFTSKTASAVVCPSAVLGRGQDNTTAVSHASGVTVKMTLTTAYWEALRDGTAIADDSINLNKIKTASEFVFDFVASGCVWSGDSYGSTLAASMTSGVVYIGGKRVAVSAVTARAFTASKDTYIDVNNAGTITYTEVANNAASPALSANNIRLGIIVSGANIANVGSVNQGQEDKVLPIASSVPYAVTDSLGNLICPRDPNRRTLGYRETSTNTGIFSTETDLTGMTFTINVPTGRKVKLSGAGHFYSNVSGDTAGLRIKEGSTTIRETRVWVNASTGNSAYVERTITPTAGTHTYKLMGTRVIGTGSITFETNGASEYGWFKAELV